MKKLNFLKILKKERKLRLTEPSEEMKSSYLQKAENCLKSAKILSQNNLYENSVSESYYCMYNSLLASLFKVGIKSEKRKELNNKEDYEILLDEYQRTTLIKTGDIQQNIFKLLESEKRIALSCFEANINQCHRKPLAEAIARFPGFNYTVIHL